MIVRSGVTSYNDITRLYGSSWIHLVKNRLRELSDMGNV